MNFTMPHKLLSIALLMLLLVVVLVACGAKSPSIEIQEPWARQSPMAEGNGAVYMIIKNTGGADDALVGVESSVSKVAEIHETTMENDVMKMRPVEGQRLAVPAGGQVELKPGGYHIMLMGLKKQLQPGDKIELVLKFEKSGEKKIEAEVRKVEGMNMGG